MLRWAERMALYTRGKGIRRVRKCINLATGSGVSFYLTARLSALLMTRSRCMTAAGEVRHRGRSKRVLNHQKKKTCNMMREICHI